MDKRQIEKQIREGRGTFAGLHSLAKIVGAEMADGIMKQLNIDEGVSAEEARQVIHPPLAKNHAYISEMAAAVIGAMYKRSGIGIKAISPKYNIDRENDLVEQAENAFLTREAIEVLSLKVEDDSIRENAYASENLGLETLVTRTYDGVGVHDGKDVCQWCIDRCGENMPLNEAYAKGAFERHPGCGCELLYITRRGTERQTDWTTNTWTRIRR